MLLMAILVSIVVGTYAGFRQRAQEASSKLQVRQIATSIEAYYTDNGTYAGMTVPRLRDSYDSSLRPSTFRLDVLSADSYCVDATSAGETWRKAGPAAPIERGSCS